MPAALARPELRHLAERTAVLMDPALAAGFRLGEDGVLRIGPDADAFALRHGLELALLVAACPDRAALAGLAAARTALLFGRLDVVCGLAATLPDRPWIAALCGEAPPDAAAASTAWAMLRALQPDTGLDPTADLPRLAALWPLLNPAEGLMETGGDARLRVDPETGLNGYGCSHRPRPWAITYASSTASSVSERGYAAAEAARQRLVTAALAGQDGLAAEARDIRAALASRYGVPADGGVVLAASGTDCELFTLALSAMAATAGEKLTNILLAPEETGTGVPLAATGRHFANETARGLPVPKTGLVDGFPADTVLAPVALRDAQGAVRPAADVRHSCAQAIAAAPGRVVLHGLDVSKSGLLAPDLPDAFALTALRPGQVDVVVDACQLRLRPNRVADYVAAGWMVQITGSKFLTGPPFAGAVLLPPAIMARLQNGALPAGLAEYSARPEWPDCAATAALPPTPNAGLLLRWRAALAEAAALDAVPPATTQAILTRFTEAVRSAIRATPGCQLAEAPPLSRPPLPGSPHDDKGEPDQDGPDWDCTGTIIGFTVADATTGTALPVEEARAVYRWLNADLRAALPQADPELAALRCHIGQPAPLPMPDGSVRGMLRISAGARLISGEPSHAALGTPGRLQRECDDAMRVLRKIALILEHRAVLQASDPKPSYL